MANTLLEKFEQSYSAEPMSGCWLWLKSISKNGYGKSCANGKPIYAHRLAYQLFKGQIGDGLVIDHLCGIKSCVNPNHLQAVTGKENTRRGFIAINGAILKEEAVYNLRIPKPLKRDLEREAKAEKRSLNQHLTMILENYTKQRKQSATV